MNDEHPTQPTDVLPEQDGTLAHNEPGAVNGIAHVTGPGGAMDDARTAESPQPMDYSASDAPTLNMAPGDAGDPIAAAPSQDPVTSGLDRADVSVPAPGGIQAGTLDQDTAAGFGQDAAATLDQDPDVGGAVASMPAEDRPAGDDISAAAPSQDMAATPAAMADLPPAGTGATDSGEPAVAPEVADALAPFHPDLPVGGTPEPAPAAELSTGRPPSAPQQSAPDASPDGSDAGDDGAPVVRTARDPRLNEMAPNASMEDLLKASEQQYRALKHGDVIEGTVMKVSKDELLVDIGSKSEGIIPSHELQSLSEAEREAMQIGDELLVSVVQPENNEGHAILSLDRARQEKSWRDLQKQFEAGEVIQAEVSGYNKGGLLVNLGGVRGFVPSSQVHSIPPGEANKQAEMAKLQGKPLPLKIIEINRSRNRLILSERQAMQEQRESMRSRLLKELEQGQVRPGQVSSICDFGAFVDIGGADGLIHLSELSWKRVSHPSEVLKVGDRINVYVLSVDPNERKIALSLKRTQPEPWTTITENYQLGQLVRGTITQLTSFGAFARLEDGIEGLIHVSELAEGRVAHPRNVVKEGDVVELKVIRIDPGRKRIGLSLKRVNEDAEGGAGSQGEPGGAVDDDTASQVSEPTAGLPAPRSDRLERFERAAAGARPDQRQQQDQGSASQSRGEQSAVKPPPSEEPMSAMAHAFATRAQSLQAAVEAESSADEEEEASDEPTAALDTAPEASMPSAIDMEAITVDAADTADAADAGDAGNEGEALASVEDAGAAEPEAVDGFGLDAGDSGESEVLAGDSAEAGSETADDDAGSEADAAVDSLAGVVDDTTAGSEVIDAGDVAGSDVEGAGEADDEDTDEASAASGSEGLPSEGDAAMADDVPGEPKAEL